MDGLYTEEDIKNRHFVMKPCVGCKKYNKQDIRLKDRPCVFCGGEMGKPSQYWYSLRTFNSNKRLSAADMKKMGA